MLLRFARHFWITLFVIALAGLTDCAPEHSTAPARKIPPISADYSGNCSTQIIAEPDCVENGGGDGYTYEYYGDMGGSAELHMTVGDLGGNIPIQCISFTRSFVPARLTDASPPVTVVSGGWFQVISNSVPGRGTYRWPSGWWPATDGSGREVSIQTAAALCDFNLNTINVFFYRFYGVQIRRPAGSSGGSGGGAGGGANCETQFVTVEVNDGRGWQVFWSGYASVCS